MTMQKPLVAAVLLTAFHFAHAGQVNNLTTFTPNTPAKASEVNGNFAAVKSAVDDNDARLKAVEAGVPGMLLTQLQGNFTFPENTTGYTGYWAIAPSDASEALGTYTPTVSARAFVQTRCSFDGSAAGQILEHRVAISNPTTIFWGAQYYQRTRTPAANISVQNVNSDYFDLEANVKYDFGVYFFPGDASASPPKAAVPTPSGGANEDYCSAVVMIFRR